MCPNHGKSIKVKVTATIEAVNHNLNPSFTAYKLCGHGHVVEHISTLFSLFVI